MLSVDECVLKPQEMMVVILVQFTIQLGWAPLTYEVRSCPYFFGAYGLVIRISRTGSYHYPS